MSVCVLSVYLYAHIQSLQLFCTFAYLNVNLFKESSDVMLSFIMHSALSLVYCYNTTVFCLGVIKFCLDMSLNKINAFCHVKTASRSWNNNTCPDIMFWALQKSTSSRIMNRCVNWLTNCLILNTIYSSMKIGSSCKVLHHTSQRSMWCHVCILSAVCGESLRQIWYQLCFILQFIYSLCNSAYWIWN